VEISGTDTRVFQHGVAMILVGRPDAEDAGSDAFPAAGETGKKVRFDETGADAKVRLDNPAIDVDWGAPGSGADIDRIIDIMVQHPVIFHDVFAEFINQLLSIHWGMQAQGDNNGDIFPRYFFFQLCQYRREQAVFRAGAGIIGNQDDYLVVVTEAFQKGRAGDGRSEAGGDGFSFVSQAVNVTRVQDESDIPRRYPGSQMAIAAGKLYFGGVGHNFIITFC
jgi:hypothetical protein